MRHKLQGITVRTPIEHKRLTKSVLECASKVFGMEVVPPEREAHHKFEVQIYDIRLGRFVHHKFVSSLVEAQREMAKQRALKQRVKHVKLLGSSHRSGSKQRGDKNLSCRFGKRSNPSPPSRTIDLQLKGLQHQLIGLRTRLGVADGQAVPGSIEKCTQLIKRLEKELG